MKVLSTNIANDTHQLWLLTNNRAPLRATVVDFVSSSYDHVVTSLADLPTPSGGYIDLTSGSWIFAAPVALGSDTIRVPAGTTVFLYGAGWTNVLSGLSTLVEILGICYLNSLRMQTTGVGVGCVRLNGANAACAVVHCRMSAVLTGIMIAQGLQLNVFGGAVLSTLNGVSVQGNITDIQLLGLSTRIVNTCLAYTSGTVAACNVSACCIEAVNGISWPAASMPTRGMCIVSNDFNCSGAAFSGFTEASALVNAKANVDTGGLMSETAIVP